MTNGATQESAPIDNTSNLWVDAYVQFSIKLASGSPADQRAVYFFIGGSEDGTRQSDNLSGSNASLNPRVPSNLRLLGVMFTPDSGALTYVSNPMSVLSAFGGLGLPRKWSIVVQNRTGVTFSSTEGDHVKAYTGIGFQTI